MKLTSYTGKTICVLGQLNVVTEYIGQVAQVPIVVVSGDRQNLLGRNLLTELKLDWDEIMHVRNLDPDHSQLMAEVPDIFTEGLGELKDMKVKIHVKAYATPHFHKSRPDSHDYITINMYKGLFRYKRLPYGLAMAPSIVTYQKNAGLCAC